MKTFIAFALALSVAACSSAANHFDPDKVSELQPGVSTIADAIRQLGPPSAETNYAEGSKLLEWQSAAGTAAGGAHAAVVFDGDGRMIRVIQLTPAGKESSTAATQQAAAPSGPHPVLGISAANVSPELASDLKMSEPGGVYVAIVNPGSTAARSGLSKGDVIVSVNGAKIKDLAAFSRAMSAVSVGQTITLVVWRGGKEVPLTIAF